MDEGSTDAPGSTAATADLAEAHASRIDQRLELLTVVLLGLAAMATAWAAFQASAFDGKVTEGFTDANLNLSDANAYYSSGDQTWISDQMLFLEYQRALNEEDTEYAEFIRESMMRDELITAIEWWEEPENFENYWSPFVEENPTYTISDYADAEALLVDTDDSYDEAKDAAGHGDTYNLIAVLLAAALFALGIAGSFRAMPIRLTMILAGGAILIISSVWMLTLPMGN
jgi:hypothetical protein